MTTIILQTEVPLSLIKSPVPQENHGRLHSANGGDLLGYETKIVFANDP